MIKDFEQGKQLEEQVKNVLIKANFKVQYQPLLTSLKLRADFLVDGIGDDIFIFEVSQRNSNEDIQRLCFRSMVYKEFMGKKVKTGAIIPPLNLTFGSLRLISLLLRFYDIFLFSNDLDRLPNILKTPNSTFFEYLKEKLDNINKDFRKIIEIVEKDKIINFKEISKKTGIRYIKVKRLINRNLKILGIFEVYSEYCRIAPRFR